MSFVRARLFVRINQRLGHDSVEMERASVIGDHKSALLIPAGNANAQPFRSMGSRAVQFSQRLLSAFRWSGPFQLAEIPK
jgi:hypothetical protein